MIEPILFTLKLSKRLDYTNNSALTKALLHDPGLIDEEHRESMVEKNIPDK